MTPYYEDEWATIYHGDCREVLPLIHADAVVTDPPYGLDFPYPTYVDTRDALRQTIATAFPAMRAAAPRVFILCGPTQIALYPEADWVAPVIWDTTGTFGRYGYNQWTPVLCFGDDLPGFGNVNGTTKSDVVRISGSGGVGLHRTDAEKVHTCPKPITLMKKVVQRFTAEGDVIADPFMGSGSTLLAAKDMNRRSIGIEIEERYCEIAAQRLSQGMLDLGGAA